MPTITQSTPLTKDRQKEFAKRITDVFDQVPTMVGVDPAKEGSEKTVVWDWGNNTKDEFLEIIGKIDPEERRKQMEGTWSSQYHQAPAPANTEKEWRRQNIRGMGNAKPTILIVDDIHDDRVNMNKRFMDTMIKRLDKDAPIVVMQTRIHEDDL
ncbi:MAG: hypothetical protein COB09_18620 [Thalassobium sp.]|nr:MAG: hypothetical protein COB09_18620 [Thalassobium sp.]